MKKRVLSLVMTLVMMVSLLPNAFAAKQPTFTDVNKDMWCYDYVEFVAKNGYFLGTTPTTFSPNGNMTRQQFVTVLARMAGAKVDNSVTAFSDVPAGSYSAGSVAWAVKHGIVTGYADGTFKPTAPVTRQQMCAFMSRFMDYYTNVHGAFFLKKGTVSSFIDNDQVADYAKAPVDRCRTYGLIEGYADNYFRPANTATRAHVAAVITRLAKVLRMGGGGGGGGYDYSLTYIDTNAAEEKYQQIVVEQDEAVFTVLGDPSANADYVAVPVPAGKSEKNFVAWTDGSKMVDANGEYTITSEDGTATLNALWVSPDDLLFNAMFAAADYASKKADEKLPEANKMVAGYAGAEFDMALAAPASDDATRELTMTATASMNADNIVEKVVETAVRYAVNVVSTVTKATAKDEAKEAVALTKAEVSEIAAEVLDLIDAKEWVYGNGNRAKLENLIDEIVEEARTHNEMYKGFKYNKQFIVDGVEVKDGNTVLFSADKNGFDGITYKRAAARAAKAVAQQLYTQLKTNYAGEEYAYDLSLSAALTLDFDYSDDTVINAMVKDYCSEYKFTATVNLVQDPDVLGYRYFNGQNYAQLVVTLLMQAEYEAAAQAMVEAAMSNQSAKNYVLNMVNAKIDDMVKNGQLADLQAKTSKNVAKVLKDAAAEWVNYNVSATMLIDDSQADFYLPLHFFWTLGGKIDAAGNIVPAEGIDASRHLFDNSMLTEAIDSLVDDVIVDTLKTEYPTMKLDPNDLEGSLKDEINKMVVEKAKVEDVLSQAEQTMKTKNTESMGLLAMVVADEIGWNMNDPADSLTIAQLENFLMKQYSTDPADNQTGLIAMQDEIKGAIDAKVDAAMTGKVGDMLGKVNGGKAYMKNKVMNHLGFTTLYPAYSATQENLIIADMVAQVKAKFGVDAATINSTIESMTKTAAGQFSKYLNNVGVVKTFKDLETVQIQSLVNVMRSDLFASAVGVAEGKVASAPELLTKLAEAIAQFDENASSITITELATGNVVVIDNASQYVKDVKAAMEKGNVDKLVEEVADFLAQFGTMSIASFEKGVKIDVYAEARATEISDSITLELLVK